MKKSITVDRKNAMSFLDESTYQNMENTLVQAFSTLQEGTGPGHEFLGWVRLPQNYDKEEFRRIQEAAQRIQKQSEVLLVIGIGGSYLGARAAIELLRGHFPKQGELEVLFVGHHISSTYMADLRDYLADKDFSINVISKSGTTTEPAIAFRLFSQLLTEKYGEEAAKERIYATTDKERGALRTLADREGYESFVVPDDVGGRYSVLTPVGLLPIAAAGIDIEAIMAGAEEARMAYLEPSMDNPVFQYVALRNLLYQDGKKIELLVNYKPSLFYLGEWWKQLFGESEGKDGKGIFPASADFTTDLHSLGQYIQDGSRILFETVLSVASTNSEVLIPADEDNLDNFNYLAGKRLSEVNARAEEGTIMAHVFGGVPVIKITLPAINERYLGQLLYFFEFSCALSGYMLGVNPFDQPGVEAYKSNMFRLLGKPRDKDKK
jgi:glucose-6-phosphate isomerase